ncbi:Ig-like domain-containing protein, partial [Psychrobacter sp. H7-1]|uniref:Ig-like domain-containing protein n=1 Tax=Psychrobacter sp. H7-1 TaxID=1569265 RepID=UPI001918A6EF
MNTITVKVHDKASTIAENVVITQDGVPTVIEASKKVNYELIDQATGRAPDHIVTKRVGKDLQISFEEDSDTPDLVIEGFYDSGDSALIGLAEDGSYYYYVPDTGEIVDYVTELQAGEIEGQALGGQSQSSPWWVGATEGFNAIPWLVGLAGVGIAAAVMGNDNNSNKDTVAPTAPTIDSPVAGDNVVNGDEAEDGFNVTGTGEPGATIELTDGSGNVIGTTTVNPDGTWSVPVDQADIDAMGEGPETITATQEDPSGNVSAPVTTDITVDTTAPDAPTAVIGNGDDFITADEIDEAGNVAVTVGLPADAEAGDTLVVNGVETEITPEDITAGSVVVDVPAPTEGEALEVTATIKDPAGNESEPGTDDAVRDTVDVTAPVVAISVDDLTDDNIINAAEAGENVPVTGTVTGEFQAGDVVTVTVNNTDYTTTVDADGTYSVDVPGSELVADTDGVIEASVTTEDAAGNPGSADTTKDFTV